MGIREGRGEEQEREVETEGAIQTDWETDSRLGLEGETKARGKEDRGDWDGGGGVGSEGKKQQDHERAAGLAAE